MQGSLLDVSGSLGGRGVWGRMDTCVCMAESIHCSPETVTSLLIGSTPVQNKKWKKARTSVLCKISVDQRCSWLLLLSFWLCCYFRSVLSQTTAVRNARGQYLLGSLCKVCSLKLWGTQTAQLLRAVLVLNLTLTFVLRTCCHKSFGMYPGLMDEIGPSTGWAVEL